MRAADTALACNSKEDGTIGGESAEKGPGPKTALVLIGSQHQPQRKRICSRLRRWICRIRDGWNAWTPKAGVLYDCAAFPGWEEKRSQLERNGAGSGENNGDFMPDGWALP